MSFMNTKFAHLDRLAISENIRMPAQCFARTFSTILRRRARLRGLTSTAVPREARTFSYQGGRPPPTPTVLDHICMHPHYRHSNGDWKLSFSSAVMHPTVPIYSRYCLAMHKNYWCYETLQLFALRHVNCRPFLLTYLLTDWLTYLLAYLPLSLTVIHCYHCHSLSSLTVISIRERQICVMTYHYHHSHHCHQYVTHCRSSLTVIHWQHCHHYPREADLYNDLSSLLPLSLTFITVREKQICVMTCHCHHCYAPQTPSFQLSCCAWAPLWI